MTVEEPKEVQLLLKSSLAASFFQCKLSVHTILNNIISYIDFKTSRRQLSLEDVYTAVSGKQRLYRRSFGCWFYDRQNDCIET